MKICCDVTKNPVTYAKYSFDDSDIPNLKHSLMGPKYSTNNDRFRDGIILISISLNHIQNILDLNDPITQKS